MSTINAWVESVENGYRASALSPSLWAFGDTAQEAFDKLDATIRERIGSGLGEVWALDVSAQDANPWLTIAGDLEDDPLQSDYLSAIAAYRSAVESDPNYL